MPLTLELAKRINALHFEQLPADAVHWAKVGILDTVGVTLAGSTDPGTRIVARSLASAGGPSLVFGSTARVGALDAALINGTAAHALDFDDCNNTLGGHPSVPILPALFALADEHGASGRDFIAAYVAGFETECKIALGVNFYQYMHGWHPTATIGVFGTAAACARLLRLDDAQTATALAIAASLAVRHQSQFRHDGEAAARRPMRDERPVRRAAGARRLHRQRRGARAQAGLLRSLQRRRQLRRRENPAGVGEPARHRQARHRDQAVSVLRQHASGDRRDDQCSRASTTSNPSRSNASTRGRIRAGSSTPTGPTRRARSTPSSACSTAWRARWSTAKS